MYKGLIIQYSLAFRRNEEWYPRVMYAIPCTKETGDPRSFRVCTCVRSRASVREKHRERIMRRYRAAIRQPTERTLLTQACLHKTRTRGLTSRCRRRRSPHIARRPQVGISRIRARAL